MPPPTFRTVVFQVCLLTLTLILLALMISTLNFGPYWILELVPAKAVVGYVVPYGKSRKGPGYFTMDMVDPNLFTHLIYAFADFTPDSISIKDPQDIKLLVALKQQKPDLKILVAIGGDGRSSTFSSITSSNADNFASIAYKFLIENQLDGLDVDWEFPNESEKDLFTNLLKELSTKFNSEIDRPKLLLTVAVSASVEKIGKSYNTLAFVEYVDFISVMCYDFHGHWEDIAAHHSPLFKRNGESDYWQKLNTAWAMEEWERQGAPKEKLMVGMALYSRTATLANPSQHEIGSPAVTGGGAPGPVMGEQGLLAYYEVCNDFLPGAIEVWNAELRVPYAYKDNQWVGYDNPRSLKEKVNWLKGKGYGGLMVWVTDQDDTHGVCKQGRYPLMNAINEALKTYN